MAVPSWFKANDYLTNKLAQVGNMTMDEMKAVFRSAGYPVTEEGLYRHFVDYGDSEWVSPNQYFNSSQYVAAKAAEYFSTTQPNPVQIGEIEEIFMAAGLSPWDHYQQYGWQEGVSPSTNFDQGKYLDAKLVQLQKDDAAGSWDMPKLVQVLKDLGITPIEHYYSYGVNENLSYTPTGGTSGDGEINYVYLTKDIDVLTGTSGDDIFTATPGTFNDGDRVDGDSGSDIFHAYVNDSNNATLPFLSNIQKVKFTSQSDTVDGGTNNVAGHVHVSAGQITGMNYLQNDASRAQLTVDGVRINSNAMTIAFTDSDPGSGYTALNGTKVPGVDYNVYFNSNYLKAGDAGNSLQLELIDVENAAINSNPLQVNPYDGFSFKYTNANGLSEYIKIDLTAVDKKLISGVDADYDTLVDAFNQAFALQGLDSVFTATKGTTFTESNTNKNSGVTYTASGNYVVLSATTGTIDASKTDLQTGWTASGIIPIEGGLIWSYGTSTECPLIQTTIHLDNVGQVQWADAYPDCIPRDQVYGSESGDMIVGSKATRGGIERFDVKVDRGSWLSSLSSTNNTLRLVTVEALDINGDKHAGNTNNLHNEDLTGQLYIGRTLDQAAAEKNMINFVDAQHLLSTDGLTDVKEFDAGGYDGAINIGARITAESLNKYLDDVDGKYSIANLYAPRAERGEFSYKLGDQGDALNMEVYSGIAADNDFRLVVDAGAGNDFINFQFSGNILDQQQIRNMAALRNVNLNGGAGNDTIKSWGNGAVQAQGGDGNDVIFVGQNANETYPGAGGGTITGNAVWVLNTNGQLNGQAIPDNSSVYYDAVGGAQPLQNNALATNSTVTFSGAVAGTAITVTVLLKGVASATVTVATPTAGQVTAGGLFTMSAATFNQKIAEAVVAENSQLKDILSVKDGAGYSLYIESLIDSAFVAADLALTIGGGAALNGALGAPVDSLDLYTPAIAHAATTNEYTTQWRHDNNGYTTVDVNATGDYTTAGSWSLTIDGVTYNTQSSTAAVTDDLGLIAALSSATDIQGNRLTDVVVLEDNSVGGSDGRIIIRPRDESSLHTITLDKHNPKVGAVPATGDVTGSDAGTNSINLVDAGAGDDVIVLNAQMADATYFDTLVVNGQFGHDTIFNYDGFGSPLGGVGAAADRINARGATANNGTVVLNPAAVDAASDGNRTVDVDDIVAVHGGAGVFANAGTHVGVAAVINLDAAGALPSYVFYQNAGADVTATSVTILGVMSFEQGTAALVAGDFA